MNSTQQYPENHFSLCFSTINHGASQTGRDIERPENKIKFQLLRKLREIHPHASDVGWNKDLVGQEDFLSDYLDHSSECRVVDCNNNNKYVVYCQYNSPVSPALHNLTCHAGEFEGRRGLINTFTPLHGWLLS